MKKLLFYALAAFTVMGASCSKDAEGLDTPVAEGKYTLPAVTASLDDIESRTGLGTNNVVNWSNNDKLAIVNTKTNKIFYYVLSAGAGTPIGKFEPISTAATFDALDDVKAVYPAVAASVASGKISVSINKEYTDEELAKVGITSWTKNSSAYAFTNNDIKVSYKASADFTSNNGAVPVNFKFRQLATWCNFVFNFTSNETYAMEAMESIKVTTTNGTKKISGTAEIDFTDPNQPVLKEGTTNAVEWETTGSLSSATLTKSMMLFPAVDGDQLKVEVKTQLHTFTFYATPKQAFGAGTILRFPFNVDDNFHKAETSEDFAYNVVENGDIPEFIYYGKANCLLLTGATGSLDIRPFKTNPYYWVMDEGSLVSDSSKKATYAEVIWRESTMTAITVGITSDHNTLNISGVTGTGNAVVGIYNNNTSSKKLLWSYHIWKPEINPTTALLDYKFTNSGQYQVMPIALGAMNKATVTTTGTATDATNAKSFGLYYQWGRKDPLGRPSTITAGAEVFVTTYAGATGTTAYNLGSHEKTITAADVLNGDAVSEKDGKSVDEWMIDYVTAHPTEFIVVPDGKYGNDWAGKTNDYLWGNPQGYNYPSKATLHRSIFDPCPAGYRVAPKDLWVAFTKTGNNFTANTSSEDNYPENNFNVANLNRTTHTTTLTTQRGYHFYYGMNDNGTKMWQTGNTDFYPASGYRNRTSGALTRVGSEGDYWSSAPTGGSAYAGYLSFHSSYVYPFFNFNRAYGFTVRCVREVQRASK